MKTTQRSIRIPDIILAAAKAVAKLEGHGNQSIVLNRWTAAGLKVERANIRRAKKRRGQ